MTEADEWEVERSPLEGSDAACRWPSRPWRGHRGCGAGDSGSRSRQTVFPGVYQTSLGLAHLLCMGFDPICTDNPSSQIGTRLSLSGPAPSFSQAATCGACGNLLGTHSGVTQRCSGEHLHPVRPGTNGCGPLPLFPCKLF